MSVQTVKTRLAEIQETITGVARAYSQAPASLPHTDLPIFANFTGSAKHNQDLLGIDQNQESRIYIMRLYVRTVGSGIDGEAERLCEPFFSLVPAAFMARPGLELDTLDDHVPGVQLATLQSDNGISVLTYAGELYIGIEWRLEVTEYTEVNYIG